MTHPTIENFIEAEEPRLTEIRRDLHAHPQLCYEETYASELVQRELSAAGIPFEAGIATTGVVAWIVPDGPAADRPGVALRGDMDALPIAEETGLPHASQNPGCMHACGHDGHTTIALGAALALNKIKNDLPRPVKVLFQPAEEGGAGGKRMVDAGVLTGKYGGFAVGRAFGLHCLPRLPLGTLVTRPGAMMAGTTEFDITIEGTGGHAAEPHLTHDPIVTAAAIVTAAQTMVSRAIEATDPLVLTITKINAGTAYNVIPDQATLSGTIRHINDLTVEKIHRRFTDLVTQVAAGHGCTAHVDLRPGYPVVNNDPDTVDFVQNVAADLLGEDHVIPMPTPIMGGEDFAYIGQAVPSCFSFIGVRPLERDDYPGLHTSRFDFPDAATPIGVRLMCGFALASTEDLNDQSIATDEHR